MDRLPADGQRGRRKWMEIVANWSACHKENKKYPLGSKLVGFQGVLAAFGRISTVSLVREARLEVFPQNQWYRLYRRPSKFCSDFQTRRTSSCVLFYWQTTRGKATLPNLAPLCTMRGIENHQRNLLISDGHKPSAQSFDTHQAPFHPMWQGTFANQYRCWYQRRYRW